MTPLRIGWFSTGRGPGSRALLRTAAGAIHDGLPVEIAYVFCNRARGEDPQTDEFFALADLLGVPVLALSSAAFRRRAGGKVARKGEPLAQWRLDYDDEVLKLIRPFGVDLGMLAGYMLIFGPRACERLCLLNLHPAEPGGPAGIWQELVWDLINRRADHSGITIFSAVPEVDAGPPVSYCTYSLRGGDLDALWAAHSETSAAELQASLGEKAALFKEIRRRGAAREPFLVIETLRALAEQPQRVAAVLEGNAVEPLDLTAVVEEQLDRSSGG